ncbi:Ribonuclease R [BD1-7 clade bacterium]|uniref:Ribonuclease R n=1 Tax=BD1-7 clade bacterium TaxID=2029982 RepID=A0A5S9PAL1_9GAMM|nr:Ribonuclease R [BD1-7 clade bacterium]CAA0116331.1 Ribonuclease R [BD1-7 clade bacterium]
MKKNSRNRDPFAAREAAKYDSPIASRELILATIREAGRPLSLGKLCQILGVDFEQEEALRRRLGAMIRDNQLIQNRRSQYDLRDTENAINGKVIAHKDGFGFLHPDDGTEDIFLSFREMRKVFDGDKASVIVTHTKSSGKLEGEILEVTERHTETVIGKVIIEGDNMRVIPDNPKIQHTVYIEQHHGIAVEHQQIVVVSITRQPERKKPPLGVITEVLGNTLDPGMEIDIATRSFGIPYVFPEDAQAQADKLADTPSDHEKRQRIDLRALPLVTIDGEDARDFDDAVYCEKKKSGGWRLWVAIADVSHYVGVNSPLDIEAHTRGTSVYFPERVIPMLPEKLSNGLCSLKPAVDRLCMVCEMTISANGRLSGYQFYEAVMHSHARLTYTEVDKMLTEKDDPDSLIRTSNAGLVKHIDELHRLYHALRLQREQRGAMDFETTETRIIFDAERKIDAIVPVVRNDAHKLIEECMLCANVATARFLEKHNMEALFRVHDGPSEKKLNNLRDFLGERGLTLQGGDDPDPKDYYTLSAQLKGREDTKIVQTMMLRSMSQASYDPDNRGHFGLSYPGYTHFTSPIRRYPDLLVHRAIRSVIRSEIESKHVKRVDGRKPLKKDAIYPYNMAALLALGEHTSMTERRADDATRDVMAWLKCEYLQEHLGARFTGTITGVAGFGFFVELDDLYAEGMVHISQLGADFFTFEAAKQRLIGERTRRVFHIGDRLDVVVSRIELDERRVHLTLADGDQTRIQNKRSSANAGLRKPSKRPSRGGKDSRSVRNKADTRSDTSEQKNKSKGADKKGKKAKPAKKTKKKHESRVKSTAKNSTKKPKRRAR